MNLGLNIKYLRKMRNMNQDEFGALFGKKKAAVSTWEKETSFPPLPLLIEIAKMLNVDINTLIFKDISSGKSDNNRSEDSNSKLEDLESQLKNELRESKELYKKRAEYLEEQLTKINAALGEELVSRKAEQQELLVLVAENRRYRERIEELERLLAEKG